MNNNQDVLQHSTLQCSLRGKHDESTIQYRNLKYATIPARFKDSVLNDTLHTGSDGVFDATRFGPSCPQKRGGQKLDLALLGSTRIALSYEDGQGKTEMMNELDCLHLSITIPKSASEAGHAKALPVFVWVHGGGFGIGSNSWPQYDLRRFVERSATLGKPVIGVSMNYRLGMFGNLASEEVDAKGNFGYKDVAQAFRWIKKHIDGFGGDYGDITAAGNSAGAIVLSTILCANVGESALFEKVLLMSGETTVRKPRTSYWHQRIYNDQLRFLGLDKSDFAAQRAALLQTDAEELAEKLPPLQHYCAHIDGEWLTHNITTGIMADGRRAEHQPIWCKEFVIGDTQHDGTIVKAKILDRPDAFDRLQLACQKHLQPSETDSLLSAYKLSGTASADELRNGMCLIFSELRFYLPSLTALQGWGSSSPPKRASRYHFHVPNPFEGRFKGLASHEIDVVYLLQNFREHFDRSDCEIANQMTDHVISYVNGEGWAKQDKLVVFAPEGRKEMEEDEYDRLYRSGRGRLLENIGHARLWDVAEAWMGVRSEHKERAKM
ncbi:hypothetical protein M3J09_002747 [Ascochyta lentis]